MVENVLGGNVKNILLIISFLVILFGCAANRPAKRTFQVPFSNGNIPDSSNVRSAVYETPPAPIKQVPPIYPEYLRNQKLQGQVWLEVEVLENGSVGRVEVKKSLHSSKGGLDESAVNAVKKWKFKPAKSDGKPVACWVIFPVTFSLK